MFIYCVVDSFGFEVEMENCALSEQMREEKTITTLLPIETIHYKYQSKLLN